MYYIRNTSISEVAKVKCGKSYFLCKWPLVRQRSRGMVIMSSPSDMPSLARSPRPLDSPSSSVELDITRGWGARPQVLSCFTHTPLADSHSKNLLFNFIFGSRSISRSLNIEELKMISLQKYSYTDPCNSCLLSDSAPSNTSSVSPKDFRICSRSDLSSLSWSFFLCSVCLLVGAPLDVYDEEWSLSNCRL